MDDGKQASVTEEARALGTSFDASAGGRAVASECGTNHSSYRTGNIAIDVPKKYLDLEKPTTKMPSPNVTCLPMTATVYLSMLGLFWGYIAIRNLANASYVNDCSSTNSVCIAQGWLDTSICVDTSNGTAEYAGYEDLLKIFVMGQFTWTLVRCIYFAVAMASCFILTAMTCMRVGWARAVNKTAPPPQARGWMTALSNLALCLTVIGGANYSSEVVFNGMMSAPATVCGELYVFDELSIGARDFFSVLKVLCLPAILVIVVSYSCLGARFVAMAEVQA